MNSKNRTVLCALSHGLYEPWLSILKSGQDATWLSEQLPNSFEIMHFHATPVGKLNQRLDTFHERIRWSGVKRAAMLRKIDRFFSRPLISYLPRFSKSELLSLKTPGSVIHFHFPDTYITYRWKELALFKYFLQETSSDYLFLASTASYVRPNELMKFVNTLPLNGAYAGARPYPEANFVSGACRILSRDVVQKVVENRKAFDPAVIEDMSLGNLIQSFGIEPIYTSLNNIDSIESLNQMSDEELLSKFHFRLKSGSLQDRNDVTIMNALHNRLISLGDFAHA